jgi:AcrR family transcriptional regulator
MGTRSAPLRLAQDELGETRHICALFEGAEEASAVVVPFILEGLERGDQVVHVVEDRDRYRAGLDGRPQLAAALESGQLRIEGWDEAYLIDGRFRASRMIKHLRQSMRDSSASGHPGLRLIGDMEWAQEEVPGADELVAYELELDALLHRPDDVLVCAYDVRRHSASRVAAVLSAHRAVFVDGRLRRSEAATPRASPRDRIVSAAARLFADNGVRATGVDAIIASADVAKATFYRHFPSKDDLIVAWLQDPRTGLFNRIRTKAELGASTDAGIPLQFFDGVAEWLEDDDFRGSPFLNTSVEIRDPNHPASLIIRERLGRTERYLQETLAAAGFRDAARLGTAIHILMAGAIFLAVARRSSSIVLTARDAAAQLLASAERVDAPRPER